MFHGISKDRDVTVCCPWDSWDGSQQVEMIPLKFRAELPRSPHPALMQIQLHSDFGGKHLDDGNGACKGFHVSDEMPIVEVPHIHGQVARECGYDILPEHRKEEWAEGITLLHTLLTCETKAITKEGGVRPVCGSGPCLQLRHACSDCRKQGATVNGIECILHIQFHINFAFWLEHV